MTFYNSNSLSPIDPKEVDVFVLITLPVEAAGHGGQVAAGQGSGEGQGEGIGHDASDGTGQAGATGQALGAGQAGATGQAGHVIDGA